MYPDLGKMGLNPKLQKEFGCLSPYLPGTHPMGPGWGVGAAPEAFWPSSHEETLLCCILGWF